MNTAALATELQFGDNVSEAELHRQDFVQAEQGEQRGHIEKKLNLGESGNTNSK